MKIQTRQTISKAQRSHPSLLFNRLYCAALTGLCAQFEWQSARDFRRRYGDNATEACGEEERVELRAEELVERAYLVARLAYNKLNEEADVKEFNSKVEAK